MGIPRPKRLANGTVKRVAPMLARREMVLRSDGLTEREEQLLGLTDAEVRRYGPEVKAEVKAAEGKCVIVGGLLPRILLTVRAFNSRLRREFANDCRRSGVTATVVQVLGGETADCCQTAVYDCVGTVDALERMTSAFYCQEWCYVVSATVGTTASGAGPEKVRATPGKAGKGCKGDASASFSRDGADKTERAMARDGFLGKEFIP